MRRGLVKSIDSSRQSSAQREVGEAGAMGMRVSRRQWALEMPMRWLEVEECLAGLGQRTRKASWSLDGSRVGLFDGMDIG